MINIARLHWLYII